MLEKINVVKYECLLALAKTQVDVDLAALETTLGLLLVAEQVQAAMERNLGCFNLSRGRFKVLIELMMAPEAYLTPADLASKIDVSRGTMTGLLNALANDNLIERHPSAEDRRTIFIRITAAGLALIQRMLPENFERTGKLMQHLAPDEKQTLVELLVKVKDGIGAYQDR